METSDQIAGPGEGGSAAAAPPAREPDPAPLVGVVAYWVDDNEAWWFDTADADDVAQSSERFYGLVPADLWEASTAAYKAWVRSMAAVQEAMGLDDDGMRAEVCPEWVGSLPTPFPYVRLEATLASGAKMYFGGQDTIAEAEAVLASLPDVVYVLAWDKPTEIRRADIAIDAGEHAGFTSGCYRCGHSQSEHDDRDPDGEEPS